MSSWRRQCYPIRVIPGSSLVHLLRDTLYKIYEGHIYRIHTYLHIRIPFIFIIHHQNRCMFPIYFVCYSLAFQGTYFIQDLRLLHSIWWIRWHLHIFFPWGKNRKGSTHTNATKILFSSVENIFPFL